MFFKIENNNYFYIKYSNPISKKTKLLCYIFLNIFKAICMVVFFTIIVLF